MSGNNVTKTIENQDLAGEVQRLGALLEPDELRKSSPRALYDKKVRRWQKLARKYRHDGLTRDEMADFWREIDDKRANVELVLAVTAREMDKQAVREVQQFIEEVRAIMMAGGVNMVEIVVEPEEVDAPADDEKIKFYRRQLAEKYKLSPRAKLTGALARLAAKTVEYVPVEQRDGMEVVDLLEFLETLLGDAQADDKPEKKRHFWEWGKR